MNNTKLVGLVVSLILIVGVIFYVSTGSDKESSPSNNVGNTNSGSVNVANAQVLAENSESKYIEFSQEAYDTALSEGKIVLLYFYASWCPTCRAEQPAVIGAFNELNRGEIVGFRVNYKDSDTDNYEEGLAEQFGITYQHTKVILKNGEQVLKSLESWDKDKYLEELNKL